MPAWTEPRTAPPTLLPAIAGVFVIALALPAQDSGEFTPPGINEMHLPAILPWGAAEGFSKQMLLVLLSVVFIAVFFVLAARKQQLVPGKLQFAGEAAYVCWIDLGTRWARLIGHRRMLARVT